MSHTDQYETRKQERERKVDYLVWLARCVGATAYGMATTAVWVSGLELAQKCAWQAGLTATVAVVLLVAALIEADSF